MSRKFDQFPISPLTAGRFSAWLARSEPGAVLEYHRGLLIFDRSPASELAEDERRVVARLAAAALQATEDGLVHLIQRRNGELDFSYLAIKAGTTSRPRFAQPARMASPAMLAAA
jgi:hypothetical protein